MLETQPDTFDGTERRRHQRFRVKDDALVFLGKETGTILDISMGGLAFHYAVFEEQPPIPCHLDIFLAESRFYLPHLPVSLVNEVQTLPHSIFNFLRVKRLSMKFGALSSEQRARLEDLITRNTVIES